MNRPLQRKIQMKRVSSKRARELRQYAKQRKVFLIAHPWCEICEAGPRYSDEHFKATEVHHRFRRNGDRLNDEKYWLAICRFHHDFIHSHPKEARARGWLLDKP